MGLVTFLITEKYILLTLSSFILHLFKGSFDSTLTRNLLIESIAALPNRNEPFILSHGKVLHLAIEKQHWLQIDGPSSDAVLILLAAYYVLDLNYSQNVKPALVFLQTELLGIAEEETGNASGLTFYNMLEKVKHIATSDSEVQ